MRSESEQSPIPTDPDGGKLSKTYSFSYVLLFMSLFKVAISGKPCPSQQFNNNFQSCLAALTNVPTSPFSLNWRSVTPTVEFFGLMYSGRLETSSEMRSG
ncbi:hypothetical protein WICPIJ_004786 [Wickerhamomyces pijperi]|uniref:Uncharacterized protein n=1 Tax=Wickerhamomyces pijperi TaxID=599730 RepID=A0A9P8TMJ5_WICPI|nr:hypothetical protein WICPIJ_004786 [Wickerhamomyces pijperi]